MAGRRPTKDSKPSTRPSTTSRPSNLKSTTVSRTPTTASSSRHPQGTVMAQLDTRTPTIVSSSRTQMPKLDARTPKPESSRAGADERLKTRYTSAYDIEMASRQTKIETLAPRERGEQEKWALKKLKKSTGACLDGFEWQRKVICKDNIPGGMHGYICKCGEAEGAHFVSDEMVARGGRKCYLSLLRVKSQKREWYGPFDENEIYRIYGRSKAEYLAHFYKGRGITKPDPDEDLEITRELYMAGPWPSGNEILYGWEQ